MSLLTQMELAVNTDFRSKVQMGLIRSAIAIMNEDPETANHNERVILSKKILREPSQMTNAIVQGVADDDAMSISSTDNDILTRIAGIFTAYALALNNPDMIP